jgi:1-aminocyclopropane-1-carboxylate deaminase/D-cysteine desulfhydrase-like pyridoxal-dependent ACC family enzyme
VSHAVPVRPLDLRLPSPLEELPDGRLTRAGVRLYLKRDDLISPEIPGNKWRKLKYNLAAARAQGHQVLLTFGGAYSNHIRATAAAGYYFGFATIGVVRGEEHLPLNPSLDYAVRHGMRLVYLDRVTYRDKMSPEVIGALNGRFGDFYLLPEGGSNAVALRGCAEIPGEIGRPFDLICCPCGTGGTLAGLAHGLGAGQRALGFSALKGGQFLAGDVRSLQRAAFGSPSENWSIHYDFHFGGFAKRNPVLDEFITDFEKRHALALDWVYTAKMMYGLFDLVQRGGLRPGTAAVALITG